MADMFVYVVTQQNVDKSNFT